MPKELTERQQAIFDFIAGIIRSRGAPPTIREIMEAFDINSTNGVRTTLAALEKKGHIRRHARLSRGIELVDQGKTTPAQYDTVEVPVLGRVAAGSPILATENIDSSVHVDRSLLPSSGEVFALSVQGDSMIEAGILDGDVVVARQQETADRGEIVVALIDDEATVKRFDPGSDAIRLLPENSSYEPIVVRPDEGIDFRIAGRVVGLMRRL
ncbi:MAG: transcriptional repressor LexA [Candidatus Latescibacterota bacterium]|nr:transcriptional repressor LexA [Candidatus Latescibacterota bacterium]